MPFLISHRHSGQRRRCGRLIERPFRSLRPWRSSMLPRICRHVGISDRSLLLIVCRGNAHAVVLSLTTGLPLSLFRHRLSIASEIWSQYLWASRPGAKGIASTGLAQGRKAKRQRHCKHDQCEEPIFSHVTLFHKKCIPIQDLDCSPQPSVCHSFFSLNKQARSIPAGTIPAGPARPVT
jgi:hypothetical protein